MTLWTWLSIAIALWFFIKVAMHIAARRLALPRGWIKRPNGDVLLGFNSSRTYDVNIKLKIRYGDAYGAQTIRTIRAEQYDPDWGKIHGLCSLRGEIRTFLVHRVQEAINVETGEVIDNVRHFFEELNPRLIRKTQICRDWEKEKHRWKSVAAASRYYASMPINSPHSDKTIAHWIRSHKKAQIQRVKSSQ